MSRGYTVHRHDIIDNTLYFERDCGICSNFSVIMDLLMYFKIHNIHPNKIVSKLSIYKGYDIFKEDLKVDEEKLKQWINFNPERVKNFYDKIRPSNFGFGIKKEELDLELLLTIFNTYFKTTEKIKKEADLLREKYKLNEHYNFILWRKTDKVGEVDGEYPSFSNAVDLANNSFKTVLQTDDNDILNEAKKIDRLIILNELPLSNAVNLGVHEMSLKMTNEEYKTQFGHDYKDHATKLLAIMNIASKSNVFVGYPGNISFHVCMMRGKFDNVHFFRTKNIFY